jgi:ribose/xylose/arabinose/galactoside ABC-type transport system permease subunit
MKEQSSGAPSLTDRLVVLRPLLGLVIVLGLFTALLSPRGELKTFLGPGNFQVLLHSNSVAAVLALGMLLVIISGGIDLSVGSVVALVTVVTMQAYQLIYDGMLDLGSGPQPVALGGGTWAGTQSVALASLAAVAAGMLAGGLCGLCNGLLVTRLRIAPFVATLGMLSVARGLALWVSGRHPITFSGAAHPGWVTRLQTAKAAGLVYDWNLWLQAPQTAMAQTARAVVAVLDDPNVWSVVALAAVVAVLLRRTVFGRYCYAIGSNEATARLCGVPVARTKVWVYTLAGLLAGWAGVLSFAHGSSGNPNAGVGLELIVIAAVVIGGASLSGGQGNVFGTLVGVLIWGIIDNGVGFFNADVEVKYVLIGGFFIVNTALSQWQRRRAE